MAAPAERFSGDLIAAARDPHDILHLILADGTGHGLAAAINVMPIVEPFYAMTRKGFDLGTIAQELNQKTCAWLPVERFIAATLVAVDFSKATIEVWSGGNPPCVVVDEDGRVVHSFAPRHPALGVICVQRFDAASRCSDYQRLPVDRVLRWRDHDARRAARGDGRQRGVGRATGAPDQRLSGSKR